MTITTITRNGIDLIGSEADFNAILDSGDPCEELAALKKERDELDAAMTSGVDTPPSLAGRYVRLEREIALKERDCTGYVPQPVEEKPKIQPKAQAPETTPAAKTEAEKRQERLQSKADRWSN